ncbi:esterase-like activity of phytase family protein [Acinetobacter wuhouensis]|uniref:Esterase-like activity of phytase family protein n=1 Tax=Acinetobacter wuhouensis TaxID=1879050 RepID=A0A4Q7AJT6_9GAMM|nr:esterase-like activity of phytase family protein [Acinetobacter wuhouensis]RZG47001.1 esterase-like activity of phytase family protein [Acinetobacter wuhouensis]RZG71954.1 esterase-like activity of phytase family protein [Acinetobacter wuhouensis]
MYQKFSKGVQLPYDILDIHNIPDGAKQGNFIEIRCGGFGSEISPHPTEKKQFYALTDRGPNTTYDVNGDKGKIFLDPSYTPKIGLFQLHENGTIEKIKEILLKDPTGRNITGLPNQHFGATKEIAYDQHGQVLEHGTDEYGLDSEGLVALKDGTFWVSDEYGPHVVHFDASGIEIDRINAYVQDTRRKSGYLLPLEFANRRQNRGMEGLTITPDQKTLVGIMQSAMSNPNSSFAKSDLVRIVMINLENKQVSQYLYKQEGIAYSNTAITALSSNEFLVAERDDDFYKDNPQAFKRVYKIDIRNATDLESIQNNENFQQDENLGLLIDGQTIEQYVLSSGWEGLAQHGIHPVAKKLVVDLVERLQYPHDKVEGLWVIDAQHLAVLNDDDYGFSETDGVLEQKYLDQEKNIIDSNTLYIIDQLDLSVDS